MQTSKKKKIIYCIVAIILIAFLVLPFAVCKRDANTVYTERNIIPTAFYLAMLLISIGVLLYYTIFIEKKYIWVMFSFIAVAIVNTGYFAQSLSANASEALLANRISYFGNVFLLLFMIFTVANACGINYDFGTKFILFSVSTIMFIFAATQGYLDLFYKNVQFEILDGYVKITKDYGIMHRVYILYIFAYLLVIIATVIYAVKKKKVSSKKYIEAILFCGIINVGIWFAEQFIENKMENLAFTYVVTEFFMLWIYKKLVDEGNLDTYTITMTLQSEDKSEKTLDIIVENSTASKLFSDAPSVDFTKLSVDEIKDILTGLPSENKLTDRELDVAVLLLQNLKRKDVATSLFVSEETVKTHTSHIYGKLNVSGKKELRQKAQILIKGD